MNLKQRNTTEWRWDSVDAPALGDFIRVTVAYHKASHSHRGVWVSVQPWRRENSCGHVAENTMLFSGLTVTMRSLPRFSPKVLEQCVGIIDPLCPALAEAFLRDKTEAKAMLSTAFAGGAR